MSITHNSHQTCLYRLNSITQGLYTAGAIGAVRCTEENDIIIHPEKLSLLDLKSTAWTTAYKSSMEYVGNI